MALGLGGCAANSDKVIVRNDPFTPYQEYISSSLKLGDEETLLDYRIIGRRDRKTGKVTTLARVGIAYTDDYQRKYEIVRNIRAEPLPITVIMRTPGCMKKPCTYLEEFTVEIPEARLLDGAADGYAFKVFARLGQEHVVHIPKGLIQSLVRSMDPPWMSDVKTAEAARPY